MRTNPLFIIAAKPKDSKKNDNFYSENSDIFKLIKNPPYFRYAGWNLLTLDYPKIKSGRAWEVKNGERKIIRIYEDGTVIAIAQADENFLGWGRNMEEFKGKPTLNSLAVIEFIYEFTIFYDEIKKIIADKNSDSIFKISIKNSLLADKKRLSIIPMRVTDPFYGMLYESKEIDSDFEENINIKYDEKPEFIAFKLVSKLFIHFSIPIDKIPYVGTDDAGRYFIDKKTYIKE